MKVLKFGGTSVATSQSISQVIDILKSKKETMVVVVSALGGITDVLTKCGELAVKQDASYKEQVEAIETRHFELIRELIPATKQSSVIASTKILVNELEDLLYGVSLTAEMTMKSNDHLLGFGERFSSAIIASAIEEKGLECTLIDSRKLFKTRNTSLGFPILDLEKTNRLIVEACAGEKGIVLIPGFISSDSDSGVDTTLGRGGSDYSAAIVASAIHAETLEIWTDVSGVMTANPKIVSEAIPIKQMSYKEAMELSHFGAKVIYPPTIQPVMELGIPIVVKNTFRPDDEGTIISDKDPSDSGIAKGISSVDNVALISIIGSGMIGIPGFSKRLFEALSNGNINVIIISQASSEHSISVGIKSEQVELAVAQLKKAFELEFIQNRIERIRIDEDLSIVSVVGDNMQNQVGTSGKLFSALGRNGINVLAMAQGSTERNISVVINGHHTKKALNVLHETFFLSEVKRFHLFVVGIGMVGAMLLEQIASQRNALLDKYDIELRVVGIANSRKVIFDENGLDLSSYNEGLAASKDKMNIEGFIRSMQAMNLRNTIFVDNSGVEVIARSYLEILKSSFSIVTPSKIACSSDQGYYEELQRTAKKYQVKFLYETNVGAGLPIIQTIKDLVDSGDVVHKIEAILSGSISYIFNNFDNNHTFVDCVKMAHEQGYTEPDPRDDLNGVDVMRKILILARELGETIEAEDVTNKRFLPDIVFEAPSVEEFYKILEENISDLEQLRQEAEDNNCKLKFVARYEKGGCSVGMEMISRGHSFYRLKGKDNIVLFWTNRYKDQPLIIKGAGAGSEVTASGIFADIMRIANA